MRSLCVLLLALSLSRGATAGLQCASQQSWCSAFTPSPAPPVLLVSCPGVFDCANRLHNWQVARVLEQHNLYREQHGACPMTYSTALADYISSSSGFQTTCDTDVPTYNRAPGEHLASVVVPSGDVTRWDVAEGVKDWYCTQEGCYNYGHNSQNSSALIFSQVVWKETLEVGCGLCLSAASSRAHLMCAYKEAGNIVSQFATSVGAPGTTATGCASVTTAAPTSVPTAQPTAVPTPVPTLVPAQPTSAPTSAPSSCTEQDTMKTTCPRGLPDTCRFKVQHHARVLSVAFSSDGMHFATGSDDGVRVFESATGAQTLKLACADFAVHDVVFSPDALSVAVAGAGGRAVVCDVATGALRYVLHDLGSSSTPIRKVAYSRVGGLLAGGGGNAPSTRVVRADDGALDLVIHAHARNVAFSPDGSLLATVVGSEVDEIVQIWDVATGAKVSTVASEGARVVSVAFLSGGELLRGMDSGAVLMTRWASGTVGVGVATVSAAVSMPSHVLHHATLSADGQLFAAAGTAEVVVWTAAGTVRTRLTGLDAVVAQASFSPDSNLLATAGHDGSLLMWSLV